jgi:hypothetical protein
VREEQREACVGGARIADAEHHDEQAELADRAMGHDQLDVELLERADAAVDHRDRAEDHERLAVAGHVAEAGADARDQVDAGLHHRRRVQVRADRRGRCHGARQPEVEGEDRRFRERAHEQQIDGGRRHGALRRVGDDLGQQRRARLLREQHEADQHGEPAERRHHEGLQRRRVGGAQTRRVTDEQEGEHRGALPEDEEQVDVVGQHEPEHRGREAHEDPGEARETLLAVFEVARAVEQHQGARASHQQGEERRDRVETKRDAQVELRHPLHRLDERLAREHGLRDPEQHREDARDQDGEGHEGATPETTDDRMGDDGAESEEEQHAHHRSHRRPASVTSVVSSIHSIGTEDSAPDSAGARARRRRAPRKREKP